MATYTSERIRQGLPRVPGGPGWPDVDGAVAASGAAVAAPASAATEPAPAAAATSPAAPSSAAVAPPVAPAPVAAATAPEISAAGGTVQKAIRQGLPRVPGGDPWPAGGTVAVAGATTSQLAASTVSTEAATEASPASDASGDAEPATALSSAAEPGQPAAASVAAANGKSAVGAGVTTESVEVTLRQGLPRAAGGDPWPAAAAISVQRAVATLPAVDAAGAAGAPTAAAERSAPAAAAPGDGSPAPAQIAASESAPAPTEKTTSAAAPADAPAAQAQPAPAATPQTLAPAAMPKREPIMIGSRSLAQWVRLAVLWGGGAIVAAGIIVLAARGVTTLPGVPEFMQRYPGEYELPEFVEPGFPPWVRWAHFLNFFLMVLIIRSGLLVRQQQKPDAFFTPKKQGGKKISIYLWMHTSLDVLWLLNGVIFVVLLFVTGHWARIVPTSWEVIPNALSAGLQYMTLEWSVEDGWVNYNSLQQIMYFVVVFIAAPLAAITGIRMSEWWPKDAQRLNKLYPAPVARAIHYPTMLFFVLFIIVHVFLVFTTGALKNLNHMFVGTPEISWTGFWWFAAGLLVTAAVTWAARPLVLAPIAGLFGRVSER